MEDLHTITSAKKQFYYRFQNTSGSVSFDMSEQEEIDTSKYSLFELINNNNISYLDFEQRCKIVYSWVEDFRKKKSSINRKITVNGCKTQSEVYSSSNKQTYKAINFLSNDYLNLSQHPKVIEAAKLALDKYGAGAGSAPLVMGITDLHKKLELKLAKIKSCEDALIQSSGYVTNLGVLKTLLQKHDIAIFDMFAHASLIDGASSQNINRVFFPHNDLRFLESILKKAEHSYVNKLVIVEGIYSMDGDIAPLDKITELAHKYGAWVLVDDAHALGVLGENGYGSIEHFGLEGKVDIVTGTLSKSLGSVGGFVAGKKEFINYLKYQNRSYIFSTSGFTPSIAASLSAIEIIEEEKSLRTKLFDNIKYLFRLLNQYEIDFEESLTPIVPIFFKDNNKVIKLSQLLEKEGLLVMPVVYPVVPKDKPRLRLSISSSHTKEDLNYLVKMLVKYNTLI